ncbi:MAG TPA: N-acetyl-gamma-glutamyl-phosphate reductase [Herpetosiphonaceae bacterium]
MRVGIYGATGYTGFELIRWLRRHPQAEIVFATSRSYAGKRLSDTFPTTDTLPLIDAAEADPAACDIVFLCLPHGPTTIATAQEVLAAGARVIDLSNDFRLRDPQVYTAWFKHPHTAPELLAEAVYGLPELYRDQIRQARLVANPGCYPTSVLLALLPLAEAGLLDGQVIVDAKSGVSGAGRSLSLKTHFAETNENFAPYNIGHTHRHIAEMEQELAAAGAPVHVIFSPHLLPVNRGILSTIYVRLAPDIAPDAVRALYAVRYADEPFVRVLPEGQLPTLSHSVHTNLCVLGLHQADDRGNWIITSSEDNLVKGASGQALQNMNLMLGLPETAGLL